MVFPVVSGVVSVLAYTAMQIVFKRATGASPLALTAWLGVLLPLWLLVAGVGVPAQLVFVPAVPAYWLWTSLWALLAVGSMALLIGLTQRFALVELAAYRKVFGLFLAIFIDMMLIGTRFDDVALVLMALVLAGSVLLTRERQHEQGPFPWKAVGLVFALCAVMLAQLFAYKQALVFQPDVISHMVVAKAVFAALSLLLWLVPSARQGAGSVSPLVLALVAVCFVVGSLAEGFMLQTLPLALVMLVGLGVSALFSVHDLLRRDLPATPRTLMGLMLVFSGFVLLAFYG